MIGQLLLAFISTFALSPCLKPNIFKYSPFRLKPIVPFFPCGSLTHCKTLSI